MATNNEIEFKQILNENVYHQIRNTYFEMINPLLKRTIILIRMISN